jgi:hypothetical protein
MPGTPRTIFISYKREPASQTLVQQLNRFIESEFKHLSVVFDDKGVPTGGDIRDYMEQLTKGDYIIFLIGAGFLESQWCMYELALAANMGNFKARMFPIVLPGTPLDYDLVWEHIERWTSEWEKQVARIEKQFDRNPKTITPSMFDRRNVLEQISIGCSTALDIVLRTKWLEVDVDGALDFERLKTFMRNWIGYNEEQAGTNDHIGFPAPIQDLLDHLVSIPATEFTMGDDRFSDTVRHPVQLGAYLLGQAPVTQAQWEAVMGDNPAYFHNGEAPVENVSWHDCQTFIAKLNALTGRHFRLPTEAEWEYAACATPVRDAELAVVAVFDHNSNWQSQRVGLRPANALGLQDMLGNVFEWCQDQAEQGVAEDLRAIRGGAWMSHAIDCDPRARHSELASTRHPAIGLRLAEDAGADAAAK